MIYYDIMMIYDSILVYLFGGCYHYHLMLAAKSRSNSVVSVFLACRLKGTKKATLICFRCKENMVVGVQPDFF